MLDVERALDEADRGIRALGSELSREVLNAVRDIYIPLHGADHSDLRVERDIAYGDHPRHRLNLFVPSTEVENAPVIVFVHGGGFVAGDKDDSPNLFYDNIGKWAVSRGMIGVTMNYRLAPDHQWPAGSEDVTAALRWLGDNVERFNGSKQRIFAIGHSAGGTHVAGHIADAGERQMLAGAIFVSGIFNPELLPTNSPYFGEDRSRYKDMSPLPGLVASSLPLLVVQGEYEPEFISDQYLDLLGEYLKAHGRLPHIAQLRDQNHFSAVLHVGSPKRSLADEIEEFVAETIKRDADA